VLRRLADWPDNRAEAPQWPVGSVAAISRGSLSGYSPYNMPLYLSRMPRALLDGTHDESHHRWSGPLRVVTSSCWPTTQMLISRPGGTFTPRHARRPLPYRRSSYWLSIGCSPHVTLSQSAPGSPAYRECSAWPHDLTCPTQEPSVVADRPPGASGGLACCGRSNLSEKVETRLTLRTSYWSCYGTRRRWPGNHDLWAHPREPGQASRLVALTSTWWLCAATSAVITSRGP